jgi:hypothetical protein
LCEREWELRCELMQGIVSIEGCFVLTVAGKETNLKNRKLGWSNQVAITRSQSVVKCPVKLYSKPKQGETKAILRQSVKSRFVLCLLQSNVRKNEMIPLLSWALRLHQEGNLT